MSTERVDDIIVGHLQEVANDLLMNHGSVIRAVGAFVDYHWASSQGSNIRRAVWVGAEGPVTDLPTAVGSEQAAMYLLSHIRKRIQELRQNMGRELQTFHKVVQDLEEHRNTLQKEIKVLTQKQAQIGQNEK